MLFIGASVPFSIGAWLVLILAHGEADPALLFTPEYLVELAIWNFLPWLGLAFVPLHVGYFFTLLCRAVVRRRRARRAVA